MKHLSTITILRYVIGYVFLASGIMKLLSDFSGAFAAMGIPYARNVVLIVAVTEIICAGLIILDYYVKRAVIPLIVIIIGALLLDKVPTLHEGFFVFLFNARLDIFALTVLFIIFRSK